MERTITVTHTYSQPEVEAHLQLMEGELTDFATLQAKEDAAKEAALTETIFGIKVLQPIIHRVQRAIDFIRKTLLPTSLVFDAAEIDEQAKKEVQVKTNEKHDKMQHRASLSRKRSAIVIDPLKRKYAKWLLLVTLMVGAADGGLAFNSFRYGGYTPLMALLAAVAIGSVIAVSHLLYAGWIKRAGTTLQRIARITLILVIGFVFFAWIGNLRADAANSTVSIALDGNTVSAASTPHLNGWAVAIISFVLFVAILFLSLLFWRSKTERLEQEAYNRLEKEIAAVDAEIATLEQECVAIQTAAARQKSEARIMYDYATASIRKAKGIGRSTLTLYKQTYARFHNDVIPPFFSDAPEPAYDESFQFVKPTKTEPV
jgi:hypothetical protein